MNYLSLLNTLMDIFEINEFRKITNRPSLHSGNTSFIIIEEYKDIQATTSMLDELLTITQHVNYEICIHSVQESHIQTVLTFRKHFVCYHWIIQQHSSHNKHVG